MTHHVDLREGRPEGAGCGEVVNITQSENVLMLVMLESILVDI